MHLISTLFFLAALALTAYVLVHRVKLIRQTILLGKDQFLNDRKDERLRTMLLVAFGQKKMFTKPIVGIMHFVLYIGFVLINIELLEIVIDGIIGSHRLFYPYLGSFYYFVINFFEILAFGVLVFCIVFLSRRYVLKLPRFWAREMKSWPRNDAANILFFEIVLMSLFLLMNGADYALQLQGAPHYPATGGFVISQFTAPLFAGIETSNLILVERTFWWLHILGILTFAVYVSYSKHLHIFLAFPNTYFSRLAPKGEMNNMPAITNEVKLMLGLEGASDAPAEPGKFGAKDVNDLSWKNLMDAYSCTECGRCTAACPANITGKLLSPRKIMMDTRDRLEDAQRNIKAGKAPLDDSKTLLGDYIIREEIMACTSCNACVEACPVLINPLDIILELRRFVAMEENASPQSWNMMYSNVENNFAPWAFSPSDRDAWRKKMEQPSA